MDRTFTLLNKLDQVSFHPLGPRAKPSRQILGCTIVPGCHACLIHGRLDRVFPQNLPALIIQHPDAELDLLRWDRQPLCLANDGPANTFSTRKPASPG